MNDKADKAVVVGSSKVEGARVLALRSALRLECRGLRRHSRSVLSIVKQELGVRGNGKRVLEQLDEYVEANVLPRKGVGPCKQSPPSGS